MLAGEDVMACDIVSGPSDADCPQCFWHLLEFAAKVRHRARREKEVRRKTSRTFAEASSAMQPFLKWDGLCSYVELQPSNANPTETSHDNRPQT